MNQKKILFIITKSNFGGAQKSVFETISLLSKEKFICAVACGGQGILVEKLKTLRIPTFPINSMGRDISFLKDVSSFFCIYKIIRKEKPDIVHLHSPKAGVLGVLACRLHIIFSSLYSLLSTTHYPLPTVIYTSHGWPFLEERPWWQKQILKLLSWLTIVLSSRTIVISETEKNTVSSWTGVKDKLIHIPLFLDQTHFLSKTEARKILAEKSSMSISDDEFLVGSIGELTKNKNFETAIDTMKEIPDTHYFIIGDGELMETFRKKLPKNVHLLGNIENASRLLKAFDVLLLTSIKEGLPYTLLEGTQAEIPLIATHVGSVSEVIDEGKNGFLIPIKNTAYLKDKILLLKNTSPFGTKNLAEIKKTISEKHNQNNTIGKLEKLYENPSGYPPSSFTV